MAEEAQQGVVEIDGMLCVPKTDEAIIPDAPIETADTCPLDPRFQQQNVTKWCYQMYIDYHRCRFLLGKSSDCQYFYRCYNSLCPNSWIEKWDEQIENGTFPRDLTREAHYRGAV